MKSVLLRAPLLTNSGYGVHSRQIFEWLLTNKDLNVFVQTLQWGATPWIINPNAEGGIFGKIMERAKNIEGNTFDITFQVQLPDEWDESLGRFNVGVTALVETDRCNPGWFEKMMSMDKIVVPSEFTKQVIRNTFGSVFDNKVHVIPEWFNTCLNVSDNELKQIFDDRYRFDTKFNLLTIGTLTSADSNSDRKNLVNTIGWAIEALDGQEDTGIIVKTCLGKGSVKDREMSKSVISQITNNFRTSDFPKIHLIHGNMTKQEVAALFRLYSVKGYITATRGEGYGLPLIEAAAAGVPVIATGWSGHLDFLQDSFLKVDYELETITENRIDNRIFVKGSRWANPSRESFISCINDLRKNYKIHEENSRILKKNINRLFSKDKVCKKYDKILKECI